MTSYFRLSQQQNRIWSLQKVSGPFTVQGSLSWKGPLDLDRLKNSITTIVEGKSILRTVYQLQNDSELPVQMIHGESKIAFDYNDISHLTEADQSNNVEEYKKNANTLCCDTVSCITQIGIFKIEEFVFELIVTLPALSSDSCSMKQLVRQLCDLYLEREHQKEVISYRQFSEWQNQLIGDTNEEATYFWQQYFLERQQQSTFPFQGTGTFSKMSHAETKSIFVDKTFKKRMGMVLEKTNLSASNFMITCLAILVRKYNISNHVMVAHVTANRKYKELFPTLGAIAKTLPITGVIDLDDSIKVVLEQWQKTTENTEAWSEYFNYEMLKDDEKEASLSSFPIGFEYIDLSLALPSSQEIQCEWKDIYSATDSFAIKLTCIDLGNQLQVAFTYDTSLFDPVAIELILQHYDNLVHEIVSVGLDSTIGAIAIHNNEEELRIKDQFYLGASATILNGNTGKAVESQDEPINIGYPTANTSVYILDNENMIQPIGVPGQIYIAGGGISKEYLGKVASSDEKFVKNPFTDNDSKMYHTGDLGRWLPDGTIEHLGRNDTLLKINGYIIDMKVIENALLSYDAVKNAVVMTKKSVDDGQCIVAFITADKTIDLALLKVFLATKLPSYMIPAFYKQLDNFPLTTNGKVDLKHLTSIELNDIKEKTDLKPRNEIENEIRDIWIEVLGLRNIGVRDKFYDLGGHSIKAVKIVSKISKKFNTLLSLDALLDNATIEDLAQMVAQSETTDHQSIISLDEQEYYDVSYAQGRLWVLDKFETNKIIYNIPQALLLKGKFDLEAFNKTMQTIVLRHESLRTNFISIDNVPKQRITPISSLNFKVDYVDLRNEAQSMGEVLLRADKEANTPFDLENGSLFRVKVLQIREEEHVLFFTLHHIITDAWSLGVLTNEITAIYNAYTEGRANPLVDLKLQYKDYAVWQKEQLEGESLQLHSQYWLDKLKLFPEKIKLKTDFPRPESKMLTGRHITHIIDENLTHQLNSTSKINQVSLFTVLLSSMYALFYKMTNQEDIVIGTSVAGREHVDLEGQVGFFVNLLALRTRFNGVEAFTTLMEKVKDTTVGAFSHQLYPFDKLVEDMEIERKMNQTPLFDIVVVFQNTDITSAGITMDGLEVENIGGGNIDKCEFDIIFIFFPSESEIFLHVHYSDELYENETIMIMIKKLELIFQTIIAQPQVKLLDLNIELEEEKKIKENKASLDFNF